MKKYKGGMIIAIIVLAIAWLMTVYHVHHQALAKVALYGLVFEVHSEQTGERLNIEISSPSTPTQGFDLPYLMEMPVDGPYRLFCAATEAPTIRMSHEGYDDILYSLERFECHVIGGSLPAAIIKMKKTK